MKIFAYIEKNLLIVTILQNIKHFVKNYLEIICNIFWLGQYHLALKINAGTIFN